MTPVSSRVSNCSLTAGEPRSDQRSKDMRPENAIIPSRRELLSDALGIGLVTASTWSIRDGEARSMYGQSDRSAANSGRATKNVSLTWEVFLAPSIPAI